jgi:ankyrin repeat protein
VNHQSTVRSQSSSLLLRLALGLLPLLISSLLALSQEGQTALHIACEKNNFELATLLLDRGADVNLVDQVHWLELS